MSKRVFRSTEEEPRGGLPWSERWRSEDRGLIVCWEVGRRMSQEQPELAVRARRGQLPKLGWKGGLAPEPTPKMDWKYGTLNYLAQWQGLRGEDLDIDLSEERAIVCSETGVRVVFTGDLGKFRDA